MEKEGDKRKPYSAPRITERVKIEGPAKIALEMVSEEARREKEEKERAKTVDSLTGLYNKNEFLRLAAVEAATVTRRDREEGKSPSPLHILYVDLDHLKPINDTYGHDAGTNAILAVSKRLKEVFRRAEDILCHTGGDEFLVAAGGEAEEIFSKLELEGDSRSYGVFKIKVPGIQPGNDAYELSVSVGLTPYRHQEGESIEAALNRAVHEADIEMYKAKGDRAR